MESSSVLYSRLEEKRRALDQWIRDNSDDVDGRRQFRGSLEELTSRNDEIESLKSEWERSKRAEEIIASNSGALGEMSSAIKDIPLPGGKNLGDLHPVRLPSGVHSRVSRGGGGLFGNGVAVLGFHEDDPIVVNSSHRSVEVFDLKSARDANYREGAFEASFSSDYRDAFVKMLRHTWAGLSNSEQKALQEGQDTQGGYLAPAEMVERIIVKRPTPTRVSNYVTMMDIGRQSVTIPKVNYTSDDIYSTGIRATWTGEIPASATAHRVSDSAERMFGQLTIPTYTAMLSIPVTMDLIEDSMVDLIGWLSDKFAETRELLVDNMILNGTGIGQPSGILVNPGAAGNPGVVVTGNASDLTVDGLINLTESLPEQYDDGSILVFNKTDTGRRIRLLKDSTGRPIVNYGLPDSGFASGRPRDVNGYPFIWSGFMPDVAANSHPIIFGDLRGYVLVNRIGFSMQVLNELYAETNMRLLLARVRFGGMVAEEWRIKVQKVSM